MEVGSNGPRPRLTKIDVSIESVNVGINVPSLVLEVKVPPSINVPSQPSETSETSNFSKKFLLNFGILIIIIGSFYLLYIVCSAQMSENNVEYETVEQYTIKPYNFMG